MEQLRGGQLIARALKRQGTEFVFGLRGPLCEPLLAGCTQEGIRVVDAYQHSTAGFAADAHARISGLAGVVVVGAGPAVTGVVTALATAKRAYSPVVYLATCPAQALDELGAYQQLPALSLVKPLVKYAARVNDARRLQEFIDRAFRIAHAGLPGPVYLELPSDVLLSLAEDSPDSARVLLPACPAASSEDVASTRDFLSESRRPCFVLGTQLRWSRHKERLRGLAERLGAPFFLNGMARGALPPKHPQLLSACRVPALAECDLAVVLGTPFDFRLSYGRPSLFNPDARVVQVDLDAHELGRNRAVELGIQADVGMFLRQLTDGWSPPSYADWLAHLHEVETRQRGRGSEPQTEGGAAATQVTLRRELAARLGPQDTVIGDGGKAVAAITQGLPTAWPQLLLDSGPFGAQGVGVGFAMAAALLRPEGRTVAILGAREFGLCGMEFESLVRQGLSAVAIVCTSESRDTDRWPPRYERVVEALGGHGYWVRGAEEVGQVLDEAWAADRASLVCVRLAREQAE